MPWHDLKAFVAYATGFAKPTLHFFIGMGLFALCIYLFRRHTRPLMTAWIVVLAVAFLNEAGDAVDAFAIGASIPWQNSIEDLLVTLIGPTILTMVELLLPTWREP